MKGSEKQVEFAQGIIANSLKEIDSLKGKTSDPERLLQLKAAAIALQSIEEWGLSASQVIDAGKSFNLDVPSFVSCLQVIDWLEDESLTEEGFYNKVWDQAEGC